MLHAKIGWARKRTTEESLITEEARAMIGLAEHDVAGKNKLQLPIKSRVLTRLADSEPVSVSSGYTKPRLLFGETGGCQSESD